MSFLRGFCLLCCWFVYVLVLGFEFGLFFSDYLPFKSVFLYILCISFKAYSNRSTFELGLENDEQHQMTS